MAHEGEVFVLNLPMEYRGCGAFPNDSHVHLGMVPKRITACGIPMNGALHLEDEVTVTCPDCVAELNYRSSHPEAKEEAFGVVTHKRSSRCKSSIPPGSSIIEVTQQAGLSR